MTPFHRMADNAPLNVGKPYVVIMTPTRELCTQVYNQNFDSLQAITNENSIENSFYRYRFTMKHANSPEEV